MHLIDHLLRLAQLGSEWVLYLLLVLSMLSLTIAAERWWWFRRQRQASRGLRPALVQALLEGEAAVEHLLTQRQTVEVEVLRGAWRFRAGGPEAVAEAVESELAEATRRLNQGTTFLGTVGNNAPFVGLLGTVIGVIQAFGKLNGASGDDAAMGQVMGLIGEALVATGVGILVALPAVVAFNVIQARVGFIEGEIVALGRLLQASLRITPAPVAPQPSEEAR